MRLTRLSELGNGVILYGLQYPGFRGCVSWCYLTIGPGVIIASQPEVTDCRASITNSWDEYFIRLLENLPEVGAAGSSPHWYEHYYGPEGPELDEVFLTPEGRVNWKFGGRGDPRDAAEVRVFYGDRFLCRAICPELAGIVITLPDIVKARKRRRRGLIAKLRERTKAVEQLLDIKRHDKAEKVERLSHCHVNCGL